MKKRAVIDSKGKVVNIIDAPANFQIKGHTLQDVGDVEVRIGDAFENNAFKPKPALTLTVGQLKEYLAQIRWQFETQGVEWNGHKIDTTRASQSMLTGIAVLAGRTKKLDISFKTLSGFVNLDIDGIDTLTVTVAAHVQNAFKKEAVLVLAIDAGKVTTLKEIKELFKGV